MWTYCKCRPQRPHQVTTSLEICCIANVCVSHLNLVFRRRAESDGKCWTPPFTPQHLSRKSSPPAPSPTQSSLSPLALSFVSFYLLSPLLCFFVCLHFTSYPPISVSPSSSAVSLSTTEDSSTLPLPWSFPPPGCLQTKHIQCFRK